MEARNPSFREAYAKYKYFRFGPGLDDLAYHLHAYTHVDLTSSSAKDKFFQLTRGSYEFKRDGHTYTFRVGFDQKPTSENGPNVYARAIGVLFDKNKDGIMTDGICYETTPHFIEPVQNDGRNLRFIVRNHNGVLPAHMDTCMRLVAGFVNHIRENSQHIRHGMYADFLTGPRGLPALAAGSLFESFVKDPTDCANIASLTNWEKPNRIGRTGTSPTTRVQNRIRNNSMDHHELHGTIFAMEPDVLPTNWKDNFPPNMGRFLFWYNRIKDAEDDGSLHDYSMKVIEASPCAGEAIGDSAYYFQVTLVVKTSVFAGTGLSDLLWGNTLGNKPFVIEGFDTGWDKLILDFKTYSLEESSLMIWIWDYRSRWWS